MDDSPSLRQQLCADLTDGQFVTITAIALAVTTFVLVSLDSAPLFVSTEFNASFLLSMSLLDMSFAYSDYWPVEYGPPYAVLWTLLFGLVTVLVFFGVYEVELSWTGETTVSIVAFLLAVGAQFGSAALYVRIR
jgi:hypothetical protein